MQSGRARRHTPEMHWTVGWIKRTVTALMVGLILAIIPGCSKEADSFSSVLAKIDALGLQAPGTAFASAAAMAGTSADRLRLLKRARLIDPGLAADTAALLVGSGTSSVVGLAALDAFLEAGRYEAGFQLFRTILPPAEFPLEFAETYIRAKQSGLSQGLSDSDRQWLILAYDATGQADFLHEAILNALIADDTGAARFLLNDAIAKGALAGTQAVVEMLWHYGFLDLILALGPSSATYPTLAAYGDSAFLTGQKALATSVYAELIDRYPLHSWRPYAALGRIAEETVVSELEYPLPLSAKPVSRNSGSGYWYALMLSRFPEDSAVALEYGLWLARAGFQDEAARYFDLASPGVEGGSTAEEAIARLALAGMENLPLAAIQLAASYPESALAVDSALAALFFSTSWQRFLTLNSWREVAVPRAWFWDAASLALTGDFEAAIELLKHSGTTISGFEVSYTLASYEFASGRYKDAASRYTIAAGETGSPSAKARCLVRTGDSLVAAGEPVAAAKAYTAALGVDDFNPEAMAALRRLSAP